MKTTKKPSERQRFEETMKALFRVPKMLVTEKINKKQKKGKD
jgi:hypothetical protein